MFLNFIFNKIYDDLTQWKCFITVFCMFPTVACVLCGASNEVVAEMNAKCAAIAKEIKNRR